jgi:hypothetical protein
MSFNVKKKLRMVSAQHIAHHVEEATRLEEEAHRRVV